MSILNPTPLDRMNDPRGRPYFLWDMEMSLGQFQEALRHEDPEIRAYFLGKLMRQAKPDDVFSFISLTEIMESWLRIQRYLGESKAFWSWILNLWEEPHEVVVEGARILVDTRHEILTSKLCTLLERSELRDLLDVRVLLEGGGDLERALSDAPSQDAGFSPLTLAWVLGQLPITRLSEASGWPKDESTELERFRDEFVQKITSLAAPE